MEDLIKREDAIEAIEVTDWYHQNRNKDMVSGANDNEHQAWYKADDIYKALEAVPSADRPSKEGEWEIEEFTSIYGKGYRLTCSECGDVFTATDEALLREHYCRYCGAKNTKRWKGADDE